MVAPVLPQKRIRHRRPRVVVADPPPTDQPTTRIYAKRIERSEYFDVFIDAPDGELVISGVNQPLIEAARVIWRSGRRQGRLELWDESHAWPRIIGDIEKLALLRPLKDDS